ncbi:transmembrane protein 121b [Anaeramoeba flamelloides]|uniref:Transmembrane protein 121b n=1 Tax=Anaeramoeba flamelloides TaxID=1746091 RepID=A0AAV7YAZ3_9EUKA|nr:transmembrane protein 121b [Anaeramoeba flamelloides]
MKVEDKKAEGTSKPQTKTVNKRELPINYSFVSALVALIILIAQCVLIVEYGKKVEIGMAWVAVITICFVVLMLLLIGSYLCVHFKKTSRTSYYGVYTERKGNNFLILLEAFTIMYTVLLCTVLLVYYSGSQDKLSKNEILGPTVFESTLSLSALIFYCVQRTIRHSDPLDPFRTIVELEVIEICLDTLDSVNLYCTFATALFSKELGVLKAIVPYVCGLWFATVCLRILLTFVLHRNLDHKIWYKLGIRGPNDCWDDFLFVSEKESYFRISVGLKYRAISQAIVIPIETAVLIIRIILLAKSPTKHDFIMIGKNLSSLWRSIAVLTTSSEPSDRCLQDKFKKPPQKLQASIWFFLALASFIFTCTSLDLFIQKGYSMGWVIFGITSTVLIVLLLLCSFFNKYNRFFGNIQFWLLAFFFAFVAFAGFRIPLLFWKANTFSTSVNNFFSQTILSLILQGFLVFIFGMSKLMLLFHMKNTRYADHINGYYYIRDKSAPLIINSINVEGTMDFLSAIDLFQNYQFTQLDVSSKRASIAFSFFEILSSMICYGSTWLLASSGMEAEEIPNFKAISRFVRMFVDVGSIILRIVVGAKTNTMSTIWIVKNIYQIFHGISQITRVRSEVKTKYRPNSICSISQAHRYYKDDN